MCSLHIGESYSSRGCSGRGPEDHFILSAHSTDEETEAQREEVIGGGVKSGIKRWPGWAGRKICRELLGIQRIPDFTKICAEA